jgi:DNA-binding NarL/FixJ family response regulator
VRRGLREVLVREGFEVSAVVATASEMLEIGRRRRPDMVIMNAAIGERVYGLRALVRLQVTDAITVIVFGIDSAEELAAVSEAGATACLSARCSFDDLLETLAAMTHGRTIAPGRALHRETEQGEGKDRMSRLTRRERDVLDLLVEGKSSQAISETLVISRHTARTHIQRVLKKLEVHSGLEATAIVHRNRIRPTAEAMEP